MLRVENIETFYGASQALFRVDLTVAEGKLVAMMGRNGMGKSTTIRSICGLTKPRTGKITFRGKQISNLPAYRIARLGIGLVPEGRRCFAPLTVRENLIATERPGPWTLNRAYQLFPRLKERSQQIAGTLSGGEQQMLAIARALLTNPKLLILDEATEGLAPLVRNEIWSAIRDLKTEGLSILIVDKSLKELLPIADHCVIIEKGRTAWSGKPHTLDNDPALQDRYLSI